MLVQPRWSSRPARSGRAASKSSSQIRRPPLRADQIDQRAVRRAQRGDAALARRRRAPATRGHEQRLRPGQRARARRPPAAPWRRPTGRACWKCSAAALSCSPFRTRLIAALPVQIDRLGAVPPGVAEAEAAQEAPPARGRLPRPRRIRGIRRRRSAGGGGRRRAPPASASARISERRPSRAFSRAGAARKSSLKISSDSGPR